MSPWHCCADEARFVEHCSSFRWRAPTTCGVEKLVRAFTYYFCFFTDIFFCAIQKQDMQAFRVCVFLRLWWCNMHQTLIGTEVRVDRNRSCFCFARSIEFLNLIFNFVCCCCCWCDEIWLPNLRSSSWQHYAEFEKMQFFPILNSGLCVL